MHEERNGRCPVWWLTSDGAQTATQATGARGEGDPKPRGLGMRTSQDLYYVLCTYTPLTYDTLLSLA